MLDQTNISSIVSAEVTALNCFLPINWVIELINAIAEGILYAVTQCVAYVIALLEPSELPALPTLEDILAPILDYLAQIGFNLESPLAFITDLLDAILTGIMSIVNSIPNLEIPTLAGLIATIMGALASAGFIINNAFSKILEFITGIATGLISVFTLVLESTLSVLDDIINYIKNAIPTFNFVILLPIDIAIWISSIIDSLTNYIMEIISSIPTISIGDFLIWLEDKLKWLGIKIPCIEALGTPLLNNLKANA